MTPSSTASRAGGVGDAIVTRGLRKTYNDHVRALDGLSFAVPRGAIFTLLGPNGAGKSTCVRILATLSRADSGEAYVAGVDVHARPQDVRRHIGWVPQHSGVDGDATGRENLALQASIHGLTSSALTDRVDELIERFRFDEHADRLARTYSGGTRRRLDLAMGLVHGPDVLFLDEPSAGLDPRSRSELWHEIEQLANVSGLTVLMTTHQLDEVDRLASGVAIMDRGRVIAEGTVDGLRAQLHGDTIQADLATTTTVDKVRAALDRVPHIHDVVLVDRTVHARAELGAEAAPAVLSALESVGLPAVSWTVARPSLEDVYLRHTGRTFQPAETVGVAG
jgi:ABC-2 type transport system ATP-binding protein